LLRRISGTLRNSYRTRRVQLKLDLPGLLEFHGDEREISEIVLALLENAMRYSPAGSEVILRLLVWEGEVHIEVQDQGIGIAEHELPKIFSRHYRSESAREQGQQGSGMGLWQARERAKAHGGDLQVYSVLGEGSTFTVILPRPENKMNLHRDSLSA
jgi:signal transduction histidine kinase